jgi:hypothetical protein
LHLIYLSDFGQKPVQIWLYLFVCEVHLEVGSYNLFFYDRLALHGDIPNWTLTEGRVEPGWGLLQIGNRNSESAPCQASAKKLSAQDAPSPSSPVIEALQDQPGVKPFQAIAVLSPVNWSVIKTFIDRQRYAPAMALSFRFPNAILLQRMTGKRRMDDLLRKKLSDGLIALKLMWFRQWNILGSVQSIVLSNWMAVSRLRQYSRDCY